MCSQLSLSKVWLSIFACSTLKLAAHKIVTGTAFKGSWLVDVVCCERGDVK